MLNQFGKAAVLDKETGRVWEQSPDGVNIRTWVDALTHCYQKTVGGRKGWRVPTIEELTSLVEPGNPPGGPDLPPGHPFDNVQSSDYWSATTDAHNTGGAWGVGFGDGFVLAGVVKTPASSCGACAADRGLMGFSDLSLDTPPLGWLLGMIPSIRASRYSGPRFLEFRSP